ncbi:hypothetical protein FGB62_87g054 [Gracilaria domingensis]|nr:hypothetical protein FGB62_87g054 [Gracilaria domingensis]
MHESFLLLLLLHEQDFEKGSSDREGDSEGDNTREEDKDRDGGVESERNEAREYCSGDGSSDRKLHQDTDNRDFTSKSVGDVENAVSEDFVYLTTWIEAHACTCECRLNQKVEKGFTRDGKKYSWDWKGWEPQKYFKKHPVLHDEEKQNEGTVASSLADEQGGVDIALEMGERKSRTELTQDHIVELTDGDRNV